MNEVPVVSAGHRESQVGRVHAELVFTQQRSVKPSLDFSTMLSTLITRPTCFIHGDYNILHLVMLYRDINQLLIFIFFSLKSIYFDQMAFFTQGNNIVIILITKPVIWVSETHPCLSVMVTPALPGWQLTAVR